MTHRALTLTLCAAATAIAVPARGDSLATPERARALSDQGRAYHEAGDYDHAIESFRAAYDLAPSPGLLFNLGQAYRLKGDCTDASIMYRSFLQTQPDRRERELAENQLQTVEACMSRRAMLHPLLDAGGTETAAAMTATSSSGAVDTVSTPGSGLRRAGIATGIGGGVLVGVGIYYAVQAADASAEVEQLYADGARWKDIEPIDARGKRASALATVFTIGGGAAIVGGGVMYLVGRSRASRAEAGRPTLSIAPTRGGGEVSVAWGF